MWSVETNLTANGGFLAGFNGGLSKTWVDAVGGLRGNYFFTPQVYATGWGLVGGGGADLDWDVGAGVGWKFNDTIAAIAGYRALGVDYNRDNFLFDVVQQGPILGLTVYFERKRALKNEDVGSRQEDAISQSPIERPAVMSFSRPHNSHGATGRFRCKADMAQ